MYRLNNEASHVSLPSSLMFGWFRLHTLYSEICLQFVRGDVRVSKFNDIVVVENDSEVDVVGLMRDRDHAFESTFFFL